MLPVLYSMASVRVVLPASTWAIIPKFICFNVSTRFLYWSVVVLLYYMGELLQIQETIRNVLLYKGFLQTRDILKNPTDFFVRLLFSNKIQDIKRVSQASLETLPYPVFCRNPYLFEN